MRSKWIRFEKKEQPKPAEGEKKNKEKAEVTGTVFRAVDTIVDQVQIDLQKVKAALASNFAATDFQVCFFFLFFFFCIYFFYKYFILAWLVVLVTTSDRPDPQGADVAGLVKRQLVEKVTVKTIVVSKGPHFATTVQEQLADLTADLIASYAPLHLLLLFCFAFLSFFPCRLSFHVPFFCLLFALLFVFSFSFQTKHIHSGY